MTTVLTVLAVLLVAAAAAAGVRWWQRRWWRDLEATRVLVHTVDGVTFDGHLAAVTRDGIVLEHARHVDAGQPIDGRTFLPASRVSWYQQPPAQED